MVKNQTIWTGDNLPIMRGLEDGCVDLIYLDPPFNSKRNYAAPIGSSAAGAAFKDTWTLDDVDIAWHDEIGAKSPALYSVIETAGQACDKAMKSYLIMMAIRLLEMRRILKDTGSIYLHCDPTASHYLKILMDAVFGKNNFLNEIIWAYTGPGSPNLRQFSRKHDLIYWYVKGDKWTFNSDDVRVPHKQLNTNRAGAMIVDPLTPEEREKYLKKGKVPETWWSQFSPVGRLKKERTGYPTQKPLALLQRIIQASSNPGDIVFDPFCGCATTLVAAEKLGRKWIGVDLSEKAVELVTDRMRKETDLFNRFNPIHRTDIPKRKGRRSRNIKTILYGKQGGFCNLCKVHFLDVNLTIDHIVPLAKGGLDDDDNLQLLCQRCNSIKGQRTMQEAKALFNAQKN